MGKKPIQLEERSLNRYKIIRNHPYCEGCKVQSSCACGFVKVSECIGVEYINSREEVY